METPNVNRKTGMSNFNLDSITNVLSTIMGAFTIPQTPATTIPPPLILTGAKLRPGISQNGITANVVARLSEAGLHSGDVFADGPNTTEALVSLIVEEVITAIQTDAVVSGTMAPGLQIMGMGVGNLGAPVLVQGATTQIGTFTGIIT